MEARGNEEEILCLSTNGTIFYRSMAWMKFQQSGSEPSPLMAYEPFYFLDVGQEREGFRLALQYSARTRTQTEFSCSLTEASGNRVQRQVSILPSSVEKDTVCCIFRPLQPEQKKASTDTTMEMKDSPNKRFRATLEHEVGSSSPSIPPKWDQLISTQLTLLNRFFEQAPFPIGLVEVIDKGTDCRYVFANEACSRRFGLSPDRVRSMRASLLLTQDELQEWLALFRTIERDTDFKVVFAGTRQTPSGWFETYVSHVRDSYYLFMRKDVTVAKTLELDLREQSKKLEDAVQAKNRFLAIMSHEIRTPLAGVIGSMCLLGEAKLGLEHTELVRISQLCGEQALALVDDILDVAKIDDNRGSDVVISRTPFSFHDLLEDALDVAAIPADEKALDLVCDIAIDTPDRVWGDPVRLRQVLTNLLANAVKFTTTGSITLTARAAVHASDPPTGSAESFSRLVEISVRDTGIGISPRTQTRLFQPFTQADDSTSRRYGGSGLGLYIAKRLVALMKGDLKCYSQGDGYGSTFAFTIPLEVDARVSPAPTWLVKPQTSATDRLVIVLSQSQQFARIYSEVIWRLGYMVAAHVTVEDAYAAAQTALAKTAQMPPAATTAQAEQPLSVIFLVDGSYDIHQLTSLARTGVLLLAPASSAETQNGLVVRVRKPLRRRALAQVLEQQFAHSRRMSVTMADASGGGFSVFRTNAALRILIAEDNAMNQAIIRKLLHSLGLDNILIVPDGAKAVAAAQNEHFDIILMDIMMPIMGGVEATERIRANPTIKQPKIIALTANAFLEEHRRFMRAGMDYVLTKPLRKRELAEIFVRYGHCSVADN